MIEFFTDASSPIPELTYPLSGQNMGTTMPDKLLLLLTSSYMKYLNLLDFKTDPFNSFYNKMLLRKDSSVVNYDTYFY